MIRSKIVKGLCLTLLLALCACGSMISPRRDFSAVTRDYLMRLRWMDFTGAARHFEADYRDDFLQRMSGLEDLHVVEVSLESVNFDEEGRHAQTTTVLEYYILPSATVEHLRLRQEWEYQGADRFHEGTWRIVTPFPPFP